ncbi:hypothetical protein SeLEV6574_g04587 [Synchytrium endobioticum]|uniref:Major facilitator superfamily (MFS) profile domain-containing protein n=1 Tax=Synchytrium endobioticum TaxID=286115 RepID=A0A507CYM9_9FUNG|nr:hypothetical protein SeLEV6574_g04587 [Synchytrium endobioticum]
MSTATVYLIFCVGVACLSTFSFGFHSGAINQPRDAITVCTTPNNPDLYLKDCIDMDDWSWGIFVSIFLLGGIVGGLSGGYIGAKLVYIPGTLCMVFGNTLVELSFGRFLVGVGAGTASAVVQLYVNEISPVALRGSLGTCNQLSIVLGIAASQLIGMGMSEPGLWRGLFACGLFAPVVQSAMFPFCVETPKWLLSQGLGLDAKQALNRLRGMDGVDEELTDILNVPGEDTEGAPGQESSILSEDHDDGNDADNEDNIAEPQRAIHTHPTQPMTVLSLLTTGRIRKPLLTAIGCQIAQQFSGVNGAIYYSTTIFQQSYEAQTSLILTMIMSLVNIAMTVVSLFLIERAGRKTLLIASQGGMAFCAVALVAVFNGGGGAFFVVVLLMAFVGSFAVGLGPIPWMILPELIPSYAVAPAASVCTAINWTCSFVVALVLPRAISLAGYNIFVLFGVLLVLFAAFTAVMLVETKGRKPEAILACYQRRRRYCAL